MMIPDIGRIALIHVSQDQYKTLDNTGKLTTEDTSIYNLCQVRKVIASFDNGRNGIRCKVVSCKLLPSGFFNLELSKVV